MRVLQYDPDRYSYDRVQISELHPRLNVRPTAPHIASGAADVLGAVHTPQKADVVLKCLDRDDPLRHTYLRRRWRAA